MNKNNKKESNLGYLVAFHSAKTKTGNNKCKEKMAMGNLTVRCEKHVKSLINKTTVVIKCCMLRDKKEINFLGLSSDERTAVLHWLHNSHNKR